MCECGEEKCNVYGKVPNKESGTDSAQKPKLPDGFQQSLFL